MSYAHNKLVEQFAIVHKLTGVELAVAEFLAKRAEKDGFPEKTFSAGEIADRIQKSRRAVGQALAELCKIALLQISVGADGQRSRSRGRVATVYGFIDHDAAWRLQADMKAAGTALLAERAAERIRAKTARLADRAKTARLEAGADAESDNSAKTARLESDNSAKTARLEPANRAESAHPLMKEKDSMIQKGDAGANPAPPEPPAPRPPRVAFTVSIADTMKLKGLEPSAVRSPKPPAAVSRETKPALDWLKPQSRRPDDRWKHWPTTGQGDD